MDEKVYNALLLDSLTVYDFKLQVCVCMCACAHVCVCTITYLLIVMPVVRLPTSMTSMRT